MMQHQAIRRVLIGTMLLNWLAAGLKLLVGLLSGSLGATADGLEALFDGLANIIGLVGIAVAQRPPDRDHPYGHRKFETLAALAIAFLLLLTSWNLIELAVRKFRAPAALELVPAHFLILLAAILIQGLTGRYELAQGRKLRSLVLVADARNTQANLTISLAVVAGLIGVRLGLPWLDPVIAIGVAIAIVVFALSIVRESTPILVDQAPFAAEELAAVVRGVEGVASTQRIRSRGSAGDASIDLTIRVASHHSADEAGAIADEVERRLMALPGVTDVTVHLEIEHDPTTIGEPLAILRAVGHGLGLALHECWAHRIDGRLHIEAHVGVDAQLTLGQAHALVDVFERQGLERLPEGTTLRTHIEPVERAPLQSRAAAAETVRDIQRTIEKAVAGIPGLSQAHNLRVRETGGQLYVSVDCTVFPDLPLSTAHELSTELERRLAQAIPNLASIVVHVEPPAAVDR